MEDAAVHPEEARRLDLRQIYLILRRNILLLVGAVVLAFILGLVATMLMTPKYVATASIQIDQEADRVLDTQNVQPVTAYQDADRFLQTQTDVLKSSTMALRVGQSLNLLGNPRFFEQMKVRLPEPSPGVSRPRQLRDASLRLIRDNLAITLPRESRLVSITFTSPDPDLAARVANAYAVGFINYNLQRKYDSSSYARSFLAKQLASVKLKLEQSERQLNDYSRSAGLIKMVTMPSGSGPNAQTTRTGSVTTQSLMQLNEAANTATTARIAAERKWQSASSVPVLSLPDVLNNSAVQDLLQQRAEKSAELSDEMALHKEEYPTVMNLQAQVNELNRQINTIANAIKSSINSSYKIALQSENSLLGQVNSLKGATLAEQDRDVRYNILAREADTNRTLYDGLLQRFKEVSAESGITTNNVSMVDEADPPMRPSSPKLMLNLLLALLAGLALGVALVFLRAQMDDVVRNPQDVEAKLGLHLLGIIPKVDQNDNVLELLAMPRSNVSEAYNALRTALMHASPDGHPHVLLITSSQAGEGKSTSSFAVASSLARLGLRVVLIDTDLRRPSLHRLLSVQNKIGLSSLLTRQAEIGSALSQVSIADHQFGFIPAGPIPPSPTELLASAGMKETLAELGRRYDLVVLDGPPVLGIADSPILCALADATLFVVEAERGRRGGTKSALRRLQSGRGKVLGALLTKFDPKKAGASEYYAYDYYYYGISPGSGAAASPGGAS